MSIHEHTIDWLKQIKVQQEVLADPKLVLLFVDLERAKRTLDVEQVEFVISRMRRYLKRQDKLHLLVDGYNYARFFSDGTWRKITSETDANGAMAWTFRYRRKVSLEEHTMHAWASLMYERYARFHVSRHRNKRKSARVAKSLSAKSQS